MTHKYDFSIRLITRDNSITSAAQRLEIEEARQWTHPGKKERKMAIGSNSTLSVQFGDVQKRKRIGSNNV